MQEWLKTHPGGFADDFKTYFDNLPAQELEVSLDMIRRRYDIDDLDGLFNPQKFKTRSKEIVSCCSFLCLPTLCDFCSTQKGPSSRKKKTTEDNAE